MVELQLEKLSPMPVTQIVWTIHILSRHGDPPRQNEAEIGAKAEAATSAENESGRFANRGRGHRRAQCG